VKPAVNKAVVGDNLFVAESGVHQDGLLKDPANYLPFLPEEAGAPPVRLVLGKHSGRHGVEHLYRARGVPLSEGQVQQILTHLKGSPRLPMYDSGEELDQLLVEVFGTARPATQALEPEPR
jgi:isopropylmalate/homocitrate/citramalate synthase